MSGFPETLNMTGRLDSPETSPNTTTLLADIAFILRERRLITRAVLALKPQRRRVRKSPPTRGGLFSFGGF